MASSSAQSLSNPSIALTKQFSSLKYIQGTNGIGIGILDLDYEVPKYQAMVKQPNYTVPMPEIGWDVPQDFKFLNIINSWIMYSNFSKFKFI
jgi:hypothetical protein